MLAADCMKYNLLDLANSLSIWKYVRIIFVLPYNSKYMIMSYRPRDRKTGPTNNDNHLYIVRKILSICAKTSEYITLHTISYD